MRPEPSTTHPACIGLHRFWPLWLLQAGEAEQAEDGDENLPTWPHLSLGLAQDQLPPTAHTASTESKRLWNLTQMVNASRRMNSEYVRENDVQVPGMSQ